MAEIYKITIPQLKPTLVYVLTISIYGGLAMFNESYMLYQGNNSPNNIGLTIVGYLYRQGIEKNDMGYASAWHSAACNRSGNQYYAADRDRNI